MSQETIQKLKEEIAATRAAAVEKMKEAFKNECQEFFAREPRLESFGWRQYTDYFNDGDECTFSVYADTECLAINGEKVYDVEEGSDHLAAEVVKEIGWNPSRPNPKYNAATEQLVREISDTIFALKEGLKDAFGDHKEITVYRDRVEVEDYTSHD
jgi:hypothetical protein